MLNRAVCAIQSTLSADCQGAKYFWKFAAELGGVKAWTWPSRDKVEVETDEKTERNGMPLIHSTRHHGYDVNKEVATLAATEELLPCSSSHAFCGSTSQSLVSLSSLVHRTACEETQKFHFLIICLWCDCSLWSLVTLST